MKHISSLRSELCNSGNNKSPWKAHKLCLPPASCLAYSSILTMEAVQSSEMSVNSTGLHGIILTALNSVTNLITSRGNSGAYMRPVGNTGLALTTSSLISEVLVSICYLCEYPLSAILFVAAGNARGERKGGDSALV
jgi:hypothetical protein